jgi:hypothetical protein
MFMGQQHRLTREGIADLLQVDLHDDSIHYLAYPDVEPPRRAHSPVLPSDEEISFLSSSRSSRYSQDTGLSDP